MRAIQTYRTVQLVAAGQKTQSANTAAYHEVVHLIRLVHKMNSSLAAQEIPASWFRRMRHELFSEGLMIWSSSQIY